MHALVALLLAVQPPTQAPPVPEPVDGGLLVPVPDAAPTQPIAPAVVDAGLPSAPAVDAGAQVPAAAMPLLHAVRVTEAPRIDGVLDDAAWQTAPPYADFTQQQPVPAAKPNFRTEVRFAYDDRALYVAVHCFDPQPELINTRMTRRDRQIEADFIDVQIDSRGDKKSAYLFALYPTNVQMDAIRTGDNAYDFDWDAVWSSATQKTADGWTAELAIPFSILRFNAAPDVAFRVEVERYVSRKGESEQLVLQNLSENGALLRMADLVSLKDLKQGKGLELRPFVLGRVGHRDAPPFYDPPSGNSGGLGVGGDVVYHPTSDLTLDGTLLPDFGQVEADQVILNLSTFETFFPEKRPFFLSGADLFTLHDDFGNPTQTQLFYSRRLGRVPPTPVVDSEHGYRLLDQPLSNDIWGALKLTGHASDKVTVALLDGLTRRETATLQRPDGTAFETPVAPLSNFGVARVRWDVGGGFSVAGTATGVTRRDRGLDNPLGCAYFEEDEFLAAPKDGRCTADAYTGGLDATWTSSEGTWVAMAALLGSVREGGPDKQIPDGTLIASGDPGYGGIAKFAKAGGDWVFTLDYAGFSPKLDLNEAGYLRQQNLHQFQVSTDYRTNAPHGPTLNTDTGLFAQARESTDGYDLGRHVQLGEFVRWSNFWNNYVELDFDPAYVDNRELRDGSLYERATSWSGVFTCNSDGRKALAAGGFVYWGNTRTGRSVSSSLEATWRPADRLELTLAPQLNWTNGDPRWFDTFGNGDADGPRTYKLGNLDSRSTSAVFRGTFTFSPTLTLQAYAQLYVDSGHYGPFYDASVGPGRANVKLADLAPAAPPPYDPDFKDGDLNVNVVLRWEYLPGSVAYLVYTRAQSNGDLVGDPNPNRPDLLALRRGPRDDVLLLKVSYYFGT